MLDHRIVYLFIIPERGNYNFLTNVKPAVLINEINNSNRIQSFFALL